MITAILFICSVIAIQLLILVTKKPEQPTELIYYIKRLVTDFNNQYKIPAPLKLPPVRPMGEWDYYEIYISLQSEYNELRTNYDKLLVIANDAVSKLDSMVEKDD